jgi:hypothetical protein
MVAFNGVAGRYVAAAPYLLYMTIVLGFIMNSMTGSLSRQDQSFDDKRNGGIARYRLNGWWGPPAGRLARLGACRFRFARGRTARAA